MPSFLQDTRELLRGRMGRLTWALALSAGSSAFDLVCMAVLPVFLLAALSGTTAAAGTPASLTAWLPALPLPQFTAVVVALFVLRAGYALVVGAALAQLAESVRAGIVLRLTQRYLTGPYQESVARSAAEAITATTTHAHTFSMIVVLPLLRLVLDALTIAAVLAFVAYIDPRIVAVAATVFAGVGLLYYGSVRGLFDRKSKLAVQLEGQLTQEVSLALGATREVRVFGLESYFLDRTRAITRQMTAARAWVGGAYWIPRALGELTLIGMGVGYMIFAWSGLAPSLVMSNLSVLAFAGMRVLPSFAQTLANIAYIRSGGPVTRLLAAELMQASDVLPAIPAARPPEPGPPVRSIELRALAFRYAGTSADVLAGIDLRIDHGRSVGVVGPSGAGKSTLADILLGLLAPTAGEIWLDGRPANLCTAEWRRRVGFVPQSPYIANDTLRRNIAFGIAEGEIDAQRLQRALELAQLDAVAASLPLGLETRLGDHGARLSGGQRQRVAIARALYRQREFLVLDEATSALDQDTEREITRAIAGLKGSVTTFIIAHRLSTLESCDQVIELRDGRLLPR